MKRNIFLLILSILYLLNCSTTQHVKKFNNTSTLDGKPKYYQVTSNLAIHFFIVVPIHDTLGNSSFEQALDDFTKDAVKNKAGKIHIIHKETTRFWYLLFPLTFILTPVSTEITGYVMD